MSDAPASADDPARRVWYIDLVLGAWRPREAASQLAYALGVELRPLHPDDPDRAVFATGRRAIDVEAAGDPIVTTAWEDAERIGPALWAGATVALLTPRYGLPLRLENEWLLYFLRRLGVSVTVVGDDPDLRVAKTLFDHRRIPPPDLAARPWLPAEHLRLLHFFPGLLPRAFAEHVKLNVGDAELVPVGADRFLIPRTYRDQDPAKAARDLDAMAEIERLDDGLRALCQSYCTAYFADPAALVDMSGRQFRSGSPDIAAALAERARLVARQPEDAARADLRRQETRLVERRFREMVAAPAPSRQAPAGLREKLARMKTVAEVMTGEIAGPEQELAPLIAKLKAEEPVAADDLLLLSRLADARLAKGNVGGGYFLAEAVDAALARDPDADQRVVFRNALVLARIHRLRADASDHRAAIERAYATSKGARTLHEIVEMNTLLAAGDPQPQSEPARQARLRAALAWLALEPTEGLSHRAIEAILGSAKTPRTQLDLEIAESLAEALEAAWPSLPVAARQKFPVVRGIAGANLRPERALAGLGAGVLWSPSAEIAAVYGRPRQRLIRLALAALAVLSPGIAETVAGTVLIDTNLGVDVPRTRAEALSQALRTGAKEFVYGLETLFLDEGMRPRLAAELEVRLSPIVQRIVADGPRRTVRFRRHLPDRLLSADEARIVGELGDGKAATLAAMAALLGKPNEDAEASLRALEAARVIRLDVAS